MYIWTKHSRWRTTQQGNTHEQPHWKVAGQPGTSGYHGHHCIFYRKQRAPAKPTSWLSKVCKRVSAVLTDCIMLHPFSWSGSLCSVLFIRKGLVIAFHLSSFFSRPILIFLYDFRESLSLPYSSVLSLKLSARPLCTSVLPISLRRWLGHKMDTGWVPLPLLPLLRVNTLHSSALSWSLICPFHQYWSILVAGPVAYSTLFPQHQAQCLTHSFSLKMC